MLKVIKTHIQDGVRSPNLLRKDEHEENAGVGGGAGEATWSETKKGLIKQDEILNIF